MKRIYLSQFIKFPRAWTLFSVVGKNISGVLLLFLLFFGSLQPIYAQNCQLWTHNEYTDFNSTPNSNPTSLWLNVHTKLSGQLDNNGDYVLYTGGVLTLQGISSTPTVTDYPIPAGKIVADNTVSSPVTYWDAANNMWITKVPLNYSSSDIFISAAIVNSSTGFTVSAGKKSIIDGYFYSNVPGFGSSWMYGLAAYQPQFTYTDVGAPGQVTSIGGGYKAGTPTPEVGNLVKGGSGGGGSNFTGSYSSTDSYTACLDNQASLGDFVWDDVNQNGIQDAGEAGISGVTVQLYRCSDNSLVASATTDAGGVYGFTNLPSGSYYVKFLTPSGYVISPRLQGGNTANDSNPYQTGLTDCITLAPGEHNGTIDAGMYQPSQQLGSLGDFVWNDLNKDGIQDQGEPGIPNILVELHNGAGAVIATTTTDATGHYLFSNLAAGQYYVHFTPPAGYTITLPNQGGNDALDSDIGGDGNTGWITLAAGENNITIDAGMYQTPQQPGSIGDFVWNDENHNGIQDGSESGIANVTVQLINCATNTVIATTTTNSSGAYSFTNLQPGNYAVQFVVPAGYSVSPALQGGDPTKDSNPNASGLVYCFSLSTGENNMTIDAGMYPTPPASIGDFVWKDINNNGIQDSGEPGIGNVTVHLYSCFDNSLVSTTTTNSSGMYSFTNLTPGDYYVQFVVPTGYTVSPALQGGDLTKDSNPDATGKTDCVTLTAGEDNTTIDAGLYPIPPAPASLGDFVWDDTNKNGVQDAGELGIPNVTVELHKCTDQSLVSTTSTNSSGIYSFTNITPGDYYVQFVVPVGYTVSPQGGTADLTKDSNPDATGKTSCVTLAAGENNTTVDAGMYPTPPQLGSLGDFVWNDINKNGIQDSGEPGIPNVTVELRLCSDHSVLVSSTTTDANGYYHFTGLTPGVQYFIKVLIPTGYTISPAYQGGDNTKDSNIGPDAQSSCITLAAGENNTTIDAGMYQTPPAPASLGDFVWNDTNKNGVQDAGEAGIPGVTVNLFDCNGTTVLKTTITDANGKYSFTDLAAGSYQVQFVLPTGDQFTQPNVGNDATDSDADPLNGKTACVTLIAGETNNTVDAGMYPIPPQPASLGDFVWDDTDKDGVQDAGELGIPNVTVELHKCTDQSLVSTTSTNSSGIYSFTNLTPGDYYVKVILPAGYSVSPKDQGGNDATDSDIDPLTQVTACVALIAGENNTTVDAGLYPTPPAPASLGDFVWNDTNHNGVQDAGELGIPNVTVELHKCSDQSLVGTTTTNSNGIYSFTNLTPGDYYVQFVVPTGYTVSPALQGGDLAKDSDPNASGKTACVTLLAGQNNTTVDAGMYPTPPQLGSLGDFVWNDTNKNGIQDAGEAGIPNVAVELHDGNGVVIATTLTDANGKYLFSNLTAGQYYVHFTPPAGYTITLINQGSDDTKDSDIGGDGNTNWITLAAGENNMTIDAGMYPTPPNTANIGDFVWNDLNKNGVQDQNEPGIPGVTVELHKCSDNSLVSTTTTNANGIYSFTNVTPGQYYIKITVPSGYTISPIDQGGNDALDSDINGSGQTACITLNAGDNNTTVDAGLYSTPPATASLGDFIWNDTNKNGIQDSGEPGIPNITVELHKCSDHSLVGTTTTNSSGIYSFTNLTAGDYYIKVNVPSNYTISPSNQGSDDTKDSDIGNDSQSACVTLAAGENNTTVDAGLYPTPPQTGSIGDFVWNDTNHNGIQDANEPGIPYVVVYLYDCNTNLIVSTTVTDATGHYSFTVNPGSYYVQFTAPSGYTISPSLQGGNPALDSNPDATGKTACVTIAAGENNTTIDAGMYSTPPQTGTIGDFVWNDTNHNGIQDAGESGIPNVTVILHKCSDNSVVATTITNANGIYSFTNVPAGEYYVEFIVPSGYTVSPINQGGDDAKDSDIGPDGKTACFNLAAGQTNTTVDAGLYPTTQPNTASLGDFIWNDTNHNGIQDANEPGIPGVTVELYKCSDNSLVATTTTNANGLYSFTGLTPGDYYIKVILPFGYGITLANQGTDDTKDSDIANDQKSACVTLLAGQNNTTVDAGLYPICPTPTSIGDFVWNDLNHNGIQDQGEPGLAGVTVKLFRCSDNNLLATTTTDAAGHYSFTGLPIGSYYIQVIAPAGYVTSPINQGSDDTKDSDIGQDGKTACITLAANENNMTVDGGLYIPGQQTATIGDFVWNDANNNGIQDAGELGLPNITVELHKCSDNSLVATTMTNASGYYSFTNLAPGDYYIKVLLPVGYGTAPANQGGDDTKDSDIATDGKSACITLAAGQTNNTVDAGLNLLCPAGATIGDFVWNDTNNNGIQDAGELGIPGITVELHKCSDNSLVATTTTNAAGYYSFTNVPAGEYYVKFIIPTGYAASPANQGTDDTKDSDIGADGKTACFTVIAGQTYNTVDAGFYSVPTTADLAIVKTVSKQNPQCGETFAYTIKVTNNGPAAATSVSVSDILPTPLVFVSASASTGTYNNTTGLWNFGSLAAGANATLTLNVKADCGTLNNTTIDLGVAKGYNLFVLGSLAEGSTTTQGKVAIGGDAYFNAYSVIGSSLSANSGDVLVVGNNLSFAIGAIHNGNVVYGNTTNLPQSTVTIDGGTLIHGSPINFAAAMSYLQNLSASLATNTVNGTTQFQWGQLTLTGTDPLLNVFSVSGTDLSNANNVVINVPSGSVVLVNISGQNVTWQGGLTVNGAPASNVIYNFYQANNLTIKGTHILGTVLAPLAYLNFQAGIITGEAIVYAMCGSGQFENAPFLGNIPYTANVTNTAVIASSTPVDLNPINNTSSVTTTISNTSAGGDNGGGGNNGGTGSWCSISMLNNEIIYAIAFDGNIMYAGTMGGHIYKSTDYGQTWTPMSTGLNASNIWTIYACSGHWFAGTEKGVYTFNGTQWTLTGLTGKDVHDLISMGNVLYAATWGGGVYKTTDCGVTWTQMNNGLDTYLLIQSLAVYNGELYAGTVGGGVYKYSASTNTWTKTSGGYEVIWAMASTTSKIFAGTYGDGLYQSTDGMTWNKVTSLTAPYIYSIEVDGTGKIYASSWTSGIFTSSDNGQTWTPMGLGGCGVTCVAVSPKSDKVFATTQDGKVYMIQNSMTSVSKSDVIPTEFGLKQNYPNPFNPSTTIEFDIPISGQYTLKVYDVLGQEVATLLNNDIAAGVHSVTFDAGKLTSGTYIYRLSGNNVSIVKKMILMK